jgi:hypothetical protein
MNIKRIENEEGIYHIHMETLQGICHILRLSKASTIKGDFVRQPPCIFALLSWLVAFTVSQKANLRRLKFMANVISQVYHL